MNRFSRAAWILLLTGTVLAGCGGGGGGDTRNPANTPPVAAFTATPSSGTAPLTVQLSASASVDPDGTIVSYSWNFGDSTAAASGVTASHMYASQGSFTVALTVTDSQGSFATATRLVTVSNPIVPNVVGLSEAAARSAITSAGFAVGTVTQQSSASVPAGSVISQSPPVGASVAPGSAVNLVVSTGPATVTVPNVVGLTQAAATTAITGADLVAGAVTTQSSTSVPAGSVISQNPPVGASVAPGSAVNLVVSTGPANVTVPNVVGLTQAAATTAITGAGLVVGAVTTQSSTSVPAGIVIAQAPAGGVSAAPGSQVGFVLSTGTSGSTAPVAVLRGPTEAHVGSRVTVLGDASTPSSGTYRWKLIPPPGSATVLVHRVPYNADLIPDLAGTYRVELTVNDGQQDSNTAVLSFVATHIQLTVVAPKDGGLVPDSARVAATVWSNYDVSSVRAAISGREAELTYDPDLRCDSGTSCPGFVGVVPLAGLANGHHVLTVRAVDSRGNADEASVSVVHDNPPTIAVTAPLDHSVALPSIAVDARCSDDLSGCTVSLYRYASPFREELILSAPTFVSQSIDLTRWMGSSIKLLLRAKDNAGQQTQVDRIVYIEDPARLALVAETPGEIIDVDATRAMYKVVTDSGNTLAIYDWKTTLTGEIPMPAGRQSTGRAYLTPTGAIFVAPTLSATGTPTGTHGLYLLRGGQLTDLGEVNDSGSLAVRGSFAIWNDGSNLYRVNTTSGVPQLVTSAAGNAGNTVAEDGTVAFWTTSYQIVRDQTGTQTVLTTDSSQWHTYPVTDGQSVVYKRSDPCCTNRQYAIVLIDTLGTIELTGKRELSPEPGSGYAVESGWVAFTDLGTVQQRHVFTRSPQGVTLRHTDFATSSYIERLAGNGEIVLRNEWSKRFFSRGGGLIPISGAGGYVSYGRSYWIAGKWYLAIGRALFEVNTQP